MKKLFAAMAIAAGCMSAHGEMHRLLFQADYSGTNGAFRVVSTNAINGYVEAVYVDSPAVGATGTVAITVQPLISTMAPIGILASQTIAADTYNRPRYIVTDSAGATLSTNSLARFALGGESIICTVTNIGAVSTGIVWNAVVIYSDN